MDPAQSCYGRNCAIDHAPASLTTRRIYQHTRFHAHYRVRAKERYYKGPPETLPAGNVNKPYKNKWASQSKIEYELDVSQV